MQSLGASSCPCFDQGYFWAVFCVQLALTAGGRYVILSVHVVNLSLPLLVCPVQNLVSPHPLSCSVPHEEFHPGNISFSLQWAFFWEIFWIFFYSCTCLHSSSLWRTSCIGGDPCSSGWFLFLSAFRSRGVYIIKQDIFLVCWAFPVVLSIGWRVSGSNCCGSLQKGWGSSAPERAALQGQVPILLSAASREIQAWKSPCKGSAKNQKLR